MTRKKSLRTETPETNYTICVFIHIFLGLSKCYLPLGKTNEQDEAGRFYFKSSAAKVMYFAVRYLTPTEKQKYRVLSSKFGPDCNQLIIISCGVLVALSLSLEKAQQRALNRLSLRQFENHNRERN